LESEIFARRKEEHSVELSKLLHLYLTIKLIKKMMSKNKEFELEVERIKAIFFSAQETFYIVEELYHENDVSDKEIYTKNMNSFFYYCKIYFWRNTVIELSKLFNHRDNETFNLIKFIKKLKPNGHFKSLKYDELFLDSILKRIDESQNAINNLILQRDKMYAHEDRNNQDVNNQTSFLDIKKLLDICKDLLQKITNQHFGTHLQFEMINSPKQSLKYLIECIIKGEQVIETEHLALIKSINNQ